MKKTIIRWTAIVVVGVVVAAAFVLMFGRAEARTGRSSGVMGVVMLGGQCGIISDEIEPCYPGPYSTTVVALKKGRRIARTTSDAFGNFQLRLSPGTYIIQAVGGNPRPICDPVEIVVSAGNYTEVTLNCDAGAL